MEGMEGRDGMDGREDMEGRGVGRVGRVYNI